MKLPIVELVEYKVLIYLRSQECEARCYRGFKCTQEETDCKRPRVMLDSGETA